MQTIRAGVSQLRRNGELLKLKGPITIKPGGEIREVKAGADGHQVVAISHQPATLECQLTWDPTSDPRALQEGENDTIAVVFNNGRRGVLSGALYTGELEINTEENELRASWAGTWTLD